MPSMNGFEVHIAVATGRLPYYAIESNDEDRTVTCWIPSEVGQTFTLSWACSKDIAWASCGDVTIDGISVGGMTLKPGAYGTPNRKTSYKAELSCAMRKDEPFRFGYYDVEVASSDEENSSGIRIEQGGEICLAIYRIVRTKILELRVDNPDSTCITPGVRRKCKKPKLRTHWKYGIDAPLDRGERIVTFIFKYRAFELLRLGGIVSRASLHLPAGSASASFSEKHLEVIPKVEQNLENLGPFQLIAEEPMSLGPLTINDSVASTRPNKKRKFESLMTVEPSDEELWKEIEDVRTHLNQLMTEVSYRKKNKICDMNIGSLMPRPKRPKAPTKYGYLTRAVKAKIAKENLEAKDTNTQMVKDVSDSMIGDLKTEYAPVSKMRAWN